MRQSITCLTAILAGLLTVGEVKAQISGRVGAGSGRRSNRTPQYRSQTREAPSSRSTALESRYVGVSTRQDQIRALLSATNPRYRAQYSLSSRGSQPTLVDLMLSQRNLLSARSSVVRDMLKNDDRGYYDGLDPVGLGTGSMPVNLQPSPAAQVPGGVSTTSDFLDSYESDLKRRADDFFEVGAGYFRAGDFIRAKNYFDMDREVHRDQPRAYIADVFCACEKRDMNRAYLSLVMALCRAQSADDLRIDTSKFFKSDEQLERTKNVLEIVASRSTDTAAPALLLAFYSWLQNDLPAAQEFLTKAMPDPSKRTGDKERAEAILRFAKYVEDARSAPSSAGVPGGNAR